MRTCFCSRDMGDNCTVCGLQNILFSPGLYTSVHSSEGDSTSSLMPWTEPPAPHGNCRLSINWRRKPFPCQSQEDMREMHHAELCNVGEAKALNIAGRDERKGGRRPEVHFICGWFCLLFAHVLYMRVDSSEAMESEEKMKRATGRCMEQNHASGKGWRVFGTNTGPQTLDAMQWLMHLLEALKAMIHDTQPAGGTNKNEWREAAYGRRSFYSPSSR